jgi:hypothetical protein
MKTYRIRSESEKKEILEVVAESDTGYYIRIVCEEFGVRSEYRDFLPAHIFDALLKNGVLEDFDAIEVAS